MIYQDAVVKNYGAESTQIISALQDVADALGLPIDWLSAVFALESGWNHKAINSMGGATGFIQFMPATARDLGTSTDALLNNGPYFQIQKVYEYFEPFKDKIKDFIDLYLITFYPNADGVFAGTLDKPDNWKFPNIVYLYNKGLDVSRNGDITIKDFKDYVFSKVPVRYHEVLQKKSLT
jgi:hypothetical protein